MNSWQIVFSSGELGWIAVVSILSMILFIGGFVLVFSAWIRRRPGNLEITATAGRDADGRLGALDLLNCLRSLNRHGTSRRPKSTTDAVIAGDDGR